MARNRRRFRQSARRVIGRFSETVEIVRRTEGQRSNRRWVPGEPETEIVKAAVNPIQAGEVRDVLPDGARVDSALRFFIVSRPGRELAALRTGKTQADEIRYRGVDYRVFSVEDFSAFGHIEVVALAPDR